MGFSIIWVTLFHAGITPVSEKITSIGYGGVDIFFLLSGIGLFHSFSKNQSLKQFYLKRLVRIFPTYLIVVLVMMLTSGSFELRTFLLKVSTLGYWFDSDYFDWYIPSLLMFYAVFLLVYYVSLNNNKHRLK